MIPVFALESCNINAIIPNRLADEFMGEKKIRARLRRLIVIFLAMCVAIFLVLRYVSQSVSNLYLTSIHDRLEEQAIQYENSFHFKLDADLLTLRAMAGMLQDHPDQDAKTMLLGLQEANNASQFVRLAYFEEDGCGFRLSSKEEGVVPVSLDQLPTALQDVVALAWSGTSSFSQAFYDPHVGSKVLASATPVYTDGQICGVLVSAVESDVYAEIFSSLNSGTAAIICHNGNVVASTRTHTPDGFYNLFSSPYLSDDIKEQYRAAFEDPKVSFFEFTYQGTDYYNCVLPMEVFPGSSMVITDTDHGISTSVSEIVRLAYLAVGLFSLTSVCFMLIALWLLRRYRISLSSIAYYDSLTGAYNKAKFLQLLEERLKQASPCTVVAVNIRKFKFRNELFGTPDSDVLLRHMCTILYQHLQEGEFFCRDSADRFLICLEASEEETTEYRLQTMFDQISQVADSMHPNYPLYFYCGCASSVSYASDDPLEELMGHVMMAVDVAKQGQRTTISFYNAQLHEQEKLQNYIENHMEQALTAGAFKLFLQPKIRLQDGTLGGAEALVRWINNGTQAFFPDQFIPLFEHNGFCVQLDYYMVEQACRQIRAWLDEGLPLVPISVNQTRLLFHQTGYPQRLREIAAKYQISPSWITLEILEGLAMEDVELVKQCLDELHSYGFRISMDDFGTGYSSLHTLGSLHIDELKLDRSFMVQAKLDKQGNHRKILAAIIAMSKNMNMSTVAEGVETADSEQMLQELSCDFGQGYYYSKPIPAAEFQQLYLRK